MGINLPEGISPELMGVRVARELTPGQTANLGVGIGFHAVDFVASGVVLHAEHGVFGYGPLVDNLDDEPEAEVSCTVFRQPVRLAPGAFIVDIATSFGLLRAGRIEVGVVGAYELDARGRVASWKGNDHLFGGIGGAVEVIRFSKRLIVVMHHFRPDGKSRIVSQTRLPLTSSRAADLIITDCGVLRPTMTDRLELLEIAPGIDPVELRDSTDADVYWMTEPSVMGY